jgi:hypothetical protein
MTLKWVRRGATYRRCAISTLPLMFVRRELGQICRRKPATWAAYRPTEVHFPLAPTLLG